VADRPDVIELRGLRLLGLVGVLPEERDRPQPLELDLDVEVDVTAAGLSDALDDTVDYGALCGLVEAVVVRGAPQLLERLAADLAAAVLEADGRISAVEVSVRKLRPPVPQDLATSGVRIRRQRGALGAAGPDA
jgi:7,8-dihydroneopterin aldolase/epimerase/oxygenase